MDKRSDSEGRKAAAMHNKGQRAGIWWRMKSYKDKFPWPCIQNVPQNPSTFIRMPTSHCKHPKPLQDTSANTFLCISLDLVVLLASFFPTEARNKVVLMHELHRGRNTKWFMEEKQRVLSVEFMSSNT